MNDQMSTAELEDLQRLSETYEPDVVGPCVGTRQPMDVLIHQFQLAAQQYVDKVASLALSHAYVRLIKGDGKCGWRAVVFGYFELLLQHMDGESVAREKARLMAFNELFASAGLEPTMAELFTEETWELFEMVKHRIEVGDRNESFIVDVFNDTSPTSKADSIIYHFKLMTSTFMKLNASLYEGFLEVPVEEYCATRIEATNQEIEQPGLFALTSGVVAPSGFGLEVLYLDRSEGNDVTPYNFVPEGQNLATITLLYRPGHYDMLYKPQIEVYPAQTETVGIVPTQLDASVGLGLSAFHDAFGLDEDFSLVNPPAGVSHGYGQQHPSNFQTAEPSVSYTAAPESPVSQLSAEPPTSPYPRSTPSDPFRMSLEMYRQQTEESPTYLPTEPFRK